MKQKAFIFILILIFSAGNSLFSQESAQKPSRQSALAAFNSGKYDQAYTEFNSLLQVYSKDPLYRYYCGASLVELKRSLKEALDLLEQAVRAAGVVRVLPADANFYLAKARQMNGKYTEAIEAYNFYTGEAGKKIAREKGVPDLIQQCREGRGETKDVVAALPQNKPQVIEPVREQPVTDIVSNPEILKKPENREKMIDEGMELQYLADSLTDVISLQRSISDKLTGASKDSVMALIALNGKMKDEYLKLSEQKLAVADKVNIVQEPLIKPAEPVKEPQENKVTVSPAAGKVNEKADVPQVKEVKKTEPPVPVVKNPDLYALFDILPGPGASSDKSSDFLSSFYTFSGKNWYDKDARILIDPELIPGLVYRIQLGVFRNPVLPSSYKGIVPVYGFSIKGTDKTIYYAGVFRRYADAAKALARVKEKGFADCFIVALSDGERVTQAQAGVLEKEWGKKTLMNTGPAGTSAGLAMTAADTIPPALSFRVEVLKSVKPLKEEALDAIRKIAGNRGVDILTLENNSSSYLIGKFITFESASDYCDLLMRNGYRESKVVAFLGQKEIPVETAKQLFDNLK